MMYASNRASDRDHSGQIDHVSSPDVATNAWLEGHQFDLGP